MTLVIMSLSLYANRYETVKQQIRRIMTVLFDQNSRDVGFTGMSKNDKTIIKCDGISKIVTDCGTNSVILDQLFFTLFGWYFLYALHMERQKCFLQMPMNDEYRRP